MACNNQHSGSKTKSDSSKRISILPDDETIAKRYIKWKKLLDKFDQPFEDDEDGLALEDMVELFTDDDEENSDDQQSLIGEAIESTEDEESDKENDRSRNYSALKKQLVEAVEKRKAEWKCNGMERIFDSNFALGVEHVQKWLQHCQPGTSKQVTRERKTRFTEYEGNAQMDVTHKENISILNDTQKQQLAAENSSSCIYSDGGRRRVIVHQIEKTTISTYIHESPGFNHAAAVAFPQPNFDNALKSIQDITSFKVPLVKLTKPLVQEKDKEMAVSKEGSKKDVSTKAKFQQASHIKNEIKIMPKARIAEDVKNRPGNGIKKQRAQFKPMKKAKFRRIIISSESSDESESVALDSSSDNSTDNSSLRKDHTNSKENSSNLANRIEQPVRNGLKTAEKQKPNREEKERKMVEQNDSPTRALSSTICRLDIVDKKTKTKTNEENLPTNAPEPCCTDSPDETATESSKAAQPYPLPKNYREMLSRNGRCMYKTQGIVIYHPTQSELSEKMQKISINAKDLDLSGIKSSTRRRKFDNFARVIQPNATLVYYESEDDETVMNDSNDSDDCDDPIQNFKPELCILAFKNATAHAS